MIKRDSVSENARESAWPENKAGKHGVYPHKDSSKIDMVTKETLASMKSFKGAKDVSSEWLTKQNPVRQATDAEYHPHKGQEEQ